jgi:hypothetical protein
MKRLLAILLLVGLFALPVMAMVGEELEGGEKVTEQPTLLAPKETIGQIYNKILDKKTVVYSEKTTLMKRIVTTFSQILGLKQNEIEEERTSIDVEIDGMVIAIIPLDSKFKGMELHKKCLEHQYGTDRWYECEVSL